MQLYIRLNYDKCLCVSVSLYALTSCSFFFSVELWKLPEVDATFALSLSLSTLNHTNSVSKPLSLGAETQRDLCKTD